MIDTIHPAQPLASLPASVALLGVAIAICAFGAYATAILGRRAVATRDRTLHRRWVALAILAATCAVWGDAFIVMIATSPAEVTGFEPVSMAIAFLVAFVSIGLAAHITMVGRSLVVKALGGGTLGLAISVTFHLGAGALRLAATIAWDWRLVAISVVVGIGFASFSAARWIRSRARNPLFPIALLTIAIFGDHLTAMRAMHVVGGGAAKPGWTIDVDTVSLIIGAIAILVAGLTLMAQSMNREDRRRRQADREQLQQLVEIAVEGLAICEASRIVWINRSLETMLARLRSDCIGAPVESLITGPPLSELPHDREIETRLRVRDGTGETLAPVRIIVRSISMGGRPHVVLAVRDQRERLRAEAEMHRLANCDALTGLPNRARFNASLAEMFDGASGGCALLAVDLDRFKSINDTYGHAAGDAVLIEVAERLAALVRDGDLVARLGGDEFAILATTNRDAASIGALAERAIDAISQPFVIDGRVHQIGASVGVAIRSLHGGDPESLTRSADLALYQAKADGRGVHRMFEDGMRIRVQQRNGLEQALRQAIVHGEFRLHYQPQVDTRTRLFDGAEALIRWMHPERGLVLPGEFIALAEETGLITTIGEWVLRAACLEAATWPEPLVVAVNVSPVQFRDPTLIATVEAALAWSGLPGRRLELEITESVLIDDAAHVRSVLDGLKRLGLRLSLDDFGTGYSSLGHLHRFPFDKIKIDRSFIGRVTDDRGSAAIVRAVVELGAGLGMKTTAEGVEHEAQLRFVTETGCDQMQGYLLGRPSPAEALPAAFRKVDQPIPAAERGRAASGLVAAAT